MVETKVYEINPVSRVINIPSSTVIGVESDENVERIRFQCDRFVGDNVDLSSFNLYVNYQNANGEKNVYLIEDVIADDSTITFSWLLSRQVTAYKGFVKFIVCAKRSNSTTNEWNTRVAAASVTEGLEADSEVVEQKIDVLEQILARLTALEANSTGGVVDEDAVKRIIESYLEQNPMQGLTEAKVRELATSITASALNSYYPKSVVDEKIGRVDAVVMNIVGQLDEDADGNIDIITGGLTEDRVNQLINEALGVIENGTY